jgi:hypothetical protein
MKFRAYPAKGKKGGQLPNLIVRFGDTIISPQPRDVEEIREAVGVVEETLQSFKRLLVDSRTAESLRQGGNGDARGHISEHIDDLVDLTEAGLIEIHAPELDVERLETLCAELGDHAAKVSEAFQAKDEEFTPRPTKDAADYVVTGGLFAGLLDVVSAVRGFVTLLSDIKTRNEGA